MNNEETIIMQPQNNKKAEEIKNTVETPATESAKEKGGNGKKVAAMTGAAVFGGAAGGAGTVAAANMFNKEKEEQEQEVKVEEETPAATTTAKPEPKVEEKIETEEIPVTVDENGETDYTGNAGADPVVQNPQTTPTSNDSNDDSEVQVLGVYQTEEGMEAAVLTDGEEIVAIVDVDGDGTADAFLYDENHNQQIEENEIYDVSSEHVQMSQYEEAYLAQQQEQMQQEHETFAYNANDQQDYNNDAPDLSFA